MNKIWRSMIGILLIAVLSFSSLPVFAADKEGSTEEAAKDIQKMMDMILKTYAGGDVDEQILLDGAMKGMFDTLDDYSVYYTPEEYEEFSEDVSGEFGGIGIKFHKKGDYIEASAVLPETPAEISGLKAGDIIEKVNGKSIKGWNTKKVVSVIRGKVGTKVELSIRRGVQIIEISITRGLIKINPIIVKNVSDLLENIGEKEDKAVRYIRITDFNANVASYLKKEIKKAKQEGVEGLLLDVRDNPGGYLSQVIEICRMLVPEGPVIHMVTKSGIKKDSIFLSKGSTF
jgi:carboxyl-terminal processing protease